MNNRYVFDTWAIVALLRLEEPAASEVRKLLLRAVNQQVSIALSVINLGEIFYITGRSEGEAKAHIALDTIEDAAITILPVDRTFVLTAARYKMTNRISYADSFAVAAAVALNAKLVTSDPELLALSDQVQLEPLTRSD